MADAKIQPNAASVETFLASVEPPARREDARALDALFRRVTGAEPVMWGDAIIGYGEYETVYASGRAVRWMRSGFSPRKAKHSLYLMGGYCDDLAAAERARLLERLGRHSKGKSCLYINKLADVDMGVLEQLVAADWQAMQRIFPPAN
ncbi:protein of unknown function (DU1801) [Erythrobacter litoralis]|jgi:hypothetical protein|uniref:YdhG-like domain-containing protein n=1 Tax=Erythrobacter litoralis TaxID=39960 RepID=A0A074N3Y6_9SPHN|nr:DUF1801 domain-containing protein [Erythrobacter litoralis]AOL23217.1 protein of unknown function (DU1801) [Erythrobacter litoralis]KEO92637.1 hypothetical protein EH32_15380 [Erythrobacter litoralis]MEE4338031.1 DUF1801 domain-containing protein [Erythrobacter sp.]